MNSESDIPRILKRQTHYSSDNSNTIDFCFGGVQFESKPGHKLSGGFPQSLQENSGIVPHLGHNQNLANPL
jgi:hypothetical protein